MHESRFVLDTSAWLTLIEDEDGAETVEGLIKVGDDPVPTKSMRCAPFMIEGAPASPSKDP